MAKISVVVLSDTETHADLGRMLNALELVKEAVEAGDQKELVFDGAGVKWTDADISFLSEYEGHPSLRSRIADGFQVITF